MHIEPIWCLRKHHNNINWSSHHHKFRIDWFIVLLVYWMRQYKNMQCATSGSKGKIWKHIQLSLLWPKCEPLQQWWALWPPSLPAADKTSCNMWSSYISTYLATHIYLSGHTYIYLSIFPSFSTVYFSVRPFSSINSIYHFHSREQQKLE